MFARFFTLSVLTLFALGVSGLQALATEYKRGNFICTDFEGAKENAFAMGGVAPNSPEFPAWLENNFIYSYCLLVSGKDDSQALLGLRSLSTGASATRDITGFKHVGAAYMIAKYNESNGTMKGYSGLLEEPYNIKETIEIYFDLLLLINASGRGPELGYGYPGDDKSSPVYRLEWDWQMELLSRFHLVFAHYAKFRMGFYGSENTRLLQSSSYTGDRNLFIGSNNYDYGIINNTGGTLDEVIQYGGECQSQMFPHFKPVVYEAVAKACRRFVELARTLKPLEEKRQYILAQQNCQDLNPDTCPEYFEARDAVHDYGESEFRSILKELWDTIPGGTQEVAPGAGTQGVAGDCSAIDLAVHGHDDEAPVSCEGPVVDGKAHGNWIVRFPNEHIHEGPYVDGMMHGHWEARDANGIIHEGPYVDDKAHGKWTFRYADGTVHEGPLVDGKVHGRWINRFSDGSCNSAEWSDGKQVGGTYENSC